MTSERKHMKNDGISNYDIMRNQMRVEFTRYDQQRMIEKFSLYADEDYIYIRFIGRIYRIGH